MTVNDKDFIAGKTYISLRRRVPSNCTKLFCIGHRLNGRPIFETKNGNISSPVSMMNFYDDEWEEYIPPKKFVIASNDGNHFFILGVEKVSDEVHKKYPYVITAREVREK